MINPLGHRILIQPDKLDDIDPARKRAKAAGIELLDERDESVLQRAGVDKGTVIAIGTTAFKDFGGESWCSVGDYICYAKHAGKWVKDPETDENMLILNDEDVVCSLTKTKEKDA